MFLPFDTFYKQGEGRNVHYIRYIHNLELILKFQVVSIEISDCGETKSSSTARGILMNIHKGMLVISDPVHIQGPFPARCSGIIVVLLS